MMKRFAQLAGLTALLGVMFVPAAHASTRISVQIGVPVPFAPVVVAPGPPPGYVWQQGYYVRTGFGSRWVPGMWVPARYVRSRWAGQRWERERREFDRDRNWNRDRDRRDWDRERGYYRR
jgi:WXXGXW repeat (2 copies)